MKVTDATGTGNGAKVKDNLLNTLAVNCPVVGYVSAKDSNTFILASGFVSLTTTGSMNGMMYIKNSSLTKRMFIHSVRVCSFGSGHLQIEYIKNPTGGTVVSDANASVAESANLGSSLVFPGDSFSASGDGKTLTGGTNLTQMINHSPGHSTEEYSGAIIIPNGGSLGIQVQPSVAMTVCIQVVCWFEDIA